MPPGAESERIRFSMNVGHAVHRAANEDKRTAKIAFTCATVGVKAALALDDAQGRAIDSFDEYTGLEEHKIPDVRLSNSLDNDTTMDLKVGLCHSCGKVDRKMNKCAQCHHVAYCSEACQTAHWPDHKALCKTLRNHSMGASGRPMRAGELYYKAMFREVLQVCRISAMQGAECLAGHCYMRGCYLQCMSTSLHAPLPGHWCCMDQRCMLTHAICCLCMPRLNLHACLQPQAKYTHVLPYWVGALIRNLTSASPYTASMVLTPLLWFLWHFTAFAMPAYLRQPL
jgi:MYND finger